jgi:hypothetical protein
MRRVLMAKKKYHFVQDYELLLDNIDAISRIIRHGDHAKFSIVIDGAILEFKCGFNELGALERLNDERDELIKLWKGKEDKSNV